MVVCFDGDQQVDGGGYADSPYRDWVNGHSFDFNDATRWLHLQG